MCQESLHWETVCQEVEDLDICASLQQCYNHLVVAEGKREEERRDGVEEGIGEKGVKGRRDER